MASPPPNTHPKTPGRRLPWRRKSARRYGLSSSQLHQWLIALDIEWMVGPIAETLENNAHCTEIADHELVAAQVITVAPPCGNDSRMGMENLADPPVVFRPYRVANGTERAGSG